jgi:hypothetical protein
MSKHLPLPVARPRGFNVVEPRAKFLDGSHLDITPAPQDQFAPIVDPQIDHPEGGNRRLSHEIADITRATEQVSKAGRFAARPSEVRGSLGKEL